VTASTDELRSVLNALATNVVIVTVGGRDVLHGCIANIWGEEVDPPLVACALSEQGRTLTLILAAGHFAVNVVGESQEGLVHQYAGPLSEGGDRFSGVVFHTGSLSDPILAESLAGFECQVVTTVPFGRQRIVVGAIDNVDHAVSHALCRPLIFHQGALFGRGSLRAKVDW